MLLKYQKFEFLKRKFTKIGVIFFLFLKNLLKFQNPSQRCEMKYTCPHCNQPGLLPINGKVLEDSFEIAKLFDPKTAIQVILNSISIDNKESKIFLVCKYCGFVKEVDCSVKKFLKEE
jgi:transcription elongation factor Elf1